MTAAAKFRKLRSLLMGSCNTYLCLKPESSRSRIEKLRSATNTYIFYQHAAIVRVPLKMLLFISWPFIAVMLSLRHVLLLGKIVAQESGTGRFQQFVQLLRLAWFEFIHPRYYFLFRFFDKTRMQKRGGYLCYRKNHVLFTALNGFVSGEPINNKVKFAEFCRANSLATPEIFACVERGEISFKVSPELWRAKDLVIKPLYGHKGRDILFAHAQGNGSYLFGDETLTHTELIQQIALDSRMEPFFIEERLCNHTVLESLSNGYLATIRMVSFLGQNHAPTFLAAILSVPYDEMRISNFGRGFPLKLESGEILPPPHAPMLEKWRKEFEEANQNAVGKIIPYWRETKELITQAHRLLPEYFSLGWDVAITANGPVILETNIGWDTDSIQYFHDLPLGDTEFARCAVERLNGLT